ncbi:TPA: hypothetical protein DCE37_21650 [Candidatus Latescibacteria bacterium]|nr:hypothetical protein [Candidatus Latescibacterota bacterium]|tara:strand:- start:91 stop:591 length:501 start_codon:yes stop_codon:yes gene_type:complete
MHRRQLQFIRIFLLFLFPACAGQSPRIYQFDNMETFPVCYQELWALAEEVAKSEKWRIEDSEKTDSHAYLTTEWMSYNQKGGDYGSVGISLGQANKPLNEKTQEVTVSIRVVAESEQMSRVKVTCLFRIQTSQGLSGNGQTMFGTSKGIVEPHILNIIRSRLAASP